MYWTMLRREVFGRKRQTIVVAAGLALAIALVIVVSSLSEGVTRAQSEALAGVYGVGTDITVTGTASEPSGEGGQRFEFGENDGENTDDGTTQIAQSQLMTDPMRGTLEASTLDTITALSGVEAATGALSLTNTSFSGEIPDMSDSATPPAGGSESAGTDGGQGGQMGPGGGGSSFGIDSFSVLGIDPEATTVGPLSGLELTDGRALTADDQGELVALLDSTYATNSDLAVGDTLEVGSGTVTIVGIVSSTTDQADSAADVFLPLETAQSLADVDDVVSTIYVSATSASAIDSVQSQIETAMPNATVSSQADLAEQISGSLSSASSLISSLGKWLSLIVLLVAFVIAVLLTSSGVTRRRREFGTLKAIGWSNKRVVGQIAGESLVQALIGGVAGLILGLGIIGIINAVSPTLQSGGQGAAGAEASAGTMQNMPGGGGGFGGMSQTITSSADIVLNAPITPWILLAAVGLALLGGLLAGSFAAWRAARLSPAEALRTVA